MSRWVAGVALLMSMVGAAFTVVDSPTVQSVLFGGMFIAFPVVGLILETRAPGNGIGRIFLAVGALAGVGGIAAGATFLASADSVVAGVGRWIQAWLFYPIIGLILPLLLIFPTGRLLSPRWRWAVWTAPVFVLMAGTGAAFYPWSPEEGGPNPLAVEGLSDFWLTLQDLAGVPLLVGALAGIAAVVVRYRKGDHVERQQIKWFLAAAAVLPLAIAVGDEYRDLQGVVVPIAFILFPVAVGVAVTRYRLYDIDRIISRTVSYGAVTAVLVGAFVAAVFLLRLVFPDGSQLAVAASTLAVAALFNPLRRRVQAAVDRRFNRSRYNAEKVVEAFGVDLRSQVGLPELEARLIETAVATMQPTHVSLWTDDRFGERDAVRK